MNRNPPDKKRARDNGAVPRGNREEKSVLANEGFRVAFE